MELIKELLPVFTTILGVLIGAWVSYLFARQQFRETVIVKSNQEWINKLQGLLAEFHATLYNIHANFQMEGMIRNKTDSVADLMKVNLIKSQVKLMVNPNEDKHVQLLDLMRKMTNLATEQGIKQTKEFASLDKEFITLSQSIFQREWDRVKKGK
jgi:hypothetical protein